MRSHRRSSLRTAAAAVALVAVACVSGGDGASTGTGPSAAAASTTAMSATTASSASTDLAQAIADKLLTPAAGVLSYFVDGRQEDPDENGVGHERLSESTGLLLSHAVAAGDAALFRRAAGYYRGHLRADVGLAYWKLDRTDRPVPSHGDRTFSTAPNDELRIIHGLLAGATSMGDSSYDRDARAAGRALLAGVRDGLLRDNVSWGPGPPESSDLVEVDYLAVPTMQLLGTHEPTWAEAAEHGLAVLRGAVQPGLPPRQFYDPTTRRYFCSGACSTIAGLYTALHLDSAGDRSAASEVYRFYIGRFDATGELAGAYAADGAPSGPEDIAGYALLARLATRLGEGERAAAIVQRSIAPHRQHSGPVKGLYSYDPSDASAFVNLEVLLTFDEFEGRRPPAD